MSKQEILDEQILTQLKKVQSESYPQSIRELVGQYGEGDDNSDIILRPDFQRIFRWDKEQKSRLIESIFLGLPLPSFFVSTNENGKWEIIDGLQRISTILEFMGVLNNDSLSKIPHEKSITKGLSSSDKFKYLQGLGIITWNDLSDTQKRNFRSYKLNFNILKVATDKSVKYELFQRLNTGGSQLSAQEVRSCLMITENIDFFNYIEILAKDQSFEECIASVSDNDLSQQYDKELILRFFALRYYKSGDKITSVDEFLNNKMFEFTKVFDFEKEKTIFSSTFKLLSEIYGEDVFKRKYQDGKFKRKILLPIFDILSLWTSNNLDKVNKVSLKLIIDQIWDHTILQRKIGVGPSIETKIAYALKEGQEILSSFANH